MTFVGLYNSRAQQIINCNEKRRFVSKGEADLAADDHGSGWKKPKKCPELWSYECQVCKGWHVTSSARRNA